MRVAAWISAVLFVLSVIGSITFYVRYHASDSNPWLKSFPPEAEVNINEIRDIEHLRKLALFLVRSDRTEKAAINAVYRSLIDGVTWLLLAVAAFSGYFLIVLCKALRSRRSDDGSKQ